MVYLENEKHDFPHDHNNNIVINIIWILSGEYATTFDCYTPYIVNRYN